VTPHIETLAVINPYMAEFLRCTLSSALATVLLFSSNGDDRCPTAACRDNQQRQMPHICRILSTKQGLDSLVPMA
jgi:hypothetical protein